MAPKGKEVSREALAGIENAAGARALGGTAAIAAAVGSDPVKGLPAARVAANRAAYGENRLPAKEPSSFWSHLVEALGDDMLKMLMFCAGVSIALGYWVSPPESRQADIINGLAILLAVVIVTGVNSVQNWSKDREFQSLAAVKADRSVRVVRDGALAVISVYDVVVGDVVRFESGDALPCDGLLVGGFDVSVDEACMNGEAEPASKSADEEPYLMGSTLVREGEGTMLVTAVGLSSKMGKTVAMIEEAEEQKTPLQERLDDLAEKIGNVGFAVGVGTGLILTALLFWAGWHSPEGLWAFLKAGRYMDLLQFAIIGVAIIVVAVPEGLPLAVTIALAFSMRRMMKDANLVRDLKACETMGSATVIASDKTGTLTENRMEVVEAYAFDAHAATPADLPAAIPAPGARHRLGKAIALNSTAELRGLSGGGAGGRVEYIGSPTEGALLHMAARWLGIDYATERAEAGTPLARRPFNKENKYTATVCPSEHPAKEGPIVYVTGAPEVVLGRCTHTQTLQGDEHALTPEREAYMRDNILAMARRGLRTLAVAYRRLPKAAAGGAPDKLLAGGNEGMVLLGLFGIQDPLREGVPDAVAACQAAGIRVIMVTGDHLETARSIAAQCNIYQPGSLVMEGAEFRALPPAEQAERAARLAVLARCSPADKHLLVTRLQEQNEVVAVTGDGTNDAPALKKADVGLAMGIAGTEVAKEAADIVIMDDQFKSIVASVRWGRSIKENIRKFLSFQLTINIVALFLTVFSACTSGGRSELPLKPVQLLWVNLIMDSFAALALATEPPSERLMSFKPQGKDEPLITRVMWKNMLGHAVFQSVLLLWMTQVPSSTAFWGLAPGDLGNSHHDTIVFTTFVLLQVFNLFNCRAVHDEWNVLEGFSNSIIAQFILATIVVMQVLIVQVFGAIMQTVPLTLHQWGACTLLGAASIPVGYLLKAIPQCDREMRAIVPEEVPMQRVAQRADEMGHLGRNLARAKAGMPPRHGARSPSPDGSEEDADAVAPPSASSARRRRASIARA